MPNAAPFVARPARRIAGGIVDVIVLLLFVILALGIVSRTGQTSEHVEIILITYGLYHFACFSLLGGMTPGLRFFDMQIVSARSGQNMSMAQAFVRAAFRPALLYVAGWAALLSARFPELVFTTAIAPLFVETVMMFSSPTRQTLSDFVARTLVVNVPPPQPHRAPAAPMYSATDAEFGVRPRKIT